MDKKNVQNRKIFFQFEAIKYRSSEIDHFLVFDILFLYLDHIMMYF